LFKQQEEEEAEEAEPQQTIETYLFRSFFSRPGGDNGGLGASLFVNISPAETLLMSVCYALHGNGLFGDRRLLPQQSNRSKEG
jgi:hypothetical protein